MPKYHRYRRKRKRESSPPIVEIVAVGVLVAFLLVSLLNRSVIDLGAFLFFILINVTIILFTYIFVKKYLDNRKWKTYELAQVDKMSGVTFEKYVAELFKFQGYKKVRLTPDGNDFGIDITYQDNGVKYAVQVKRYKGKVGVSAVYQATGGMKYYGCDKAMVITNSFFTAKAKELAKKTGVTLVDREVLVEWVYQFKRKD